jgi:hypothetical protein
MARSPGRNAGYEGVVRVAGFRLQPQQPWATRIGQSNPKGAVATEDCKSKAGTLERRGEDGLPSLPQPWGPSMSSSVSDLESFIRSWLVQSAILQLRVATPILRMQL